MLTRNKLIAFPGSWVRLQAYWTRHARPSAFSRAIGWSNHLCQGAVRGGYRSLARKRGPSITLNASFKCPGRLAFPSDVVFPRPCERGIGHGKPGRPCPSCVCSLPGLEDLLAIGKSNKHTFADRVLVFALKGENVRQKKFLYAHRSWASAFAPICKHITPAVS
jgi:hypothetical protein